MRPEEHLSVAGKLLTKNAASDAINEAILHLNAIPDAVPQHSEANSLMRMATIRLKQIQLDEEKRKKQAEIDKNPLEVVKSTWRLDGFGNIAIWDVTFRNRSDKPVGNIKYRTAYYSETNVKIDSGGDASVLNPGLIYKMIPPGQTRTLEINDGFVHSQVHRAAFAVVSWEFVQDKR
jgi:hypothetical protein